jgi:DNA-binding XRE family transcriptional regulator
LRALVESGGLKRADGKLFYFIDDQSTIRDKANPSQVKEVSKNSLKEIREFLMISKVELANKAGLSTKTISRIEDGLPCKIETKQKIIRALNSINSDENEIIASLIRDNGGKRSGLERRQFSYDNHIPERRSGKERRSGLDRRLKPRTSK